jgi:predicted SprT family Zn-dependent metalloprotease
MGNNSVDAILYWKRCTCKKHVKLGKVTKGSKGGAFVDCKNCGTTVELKYEGENEIVTSASAIASA